MPFSGASAWHCSGCAAVNGRERESCFACGQVRRDAAPYQEPQVAQRLEARNASRRRFLLAGLTAGAALAVGAGASLFRPTLFPAAPPWVRELDMDGTVNTVTWSPDGHLFAAGGATNHITVWRTSDGQELTRLAGPDSNAGTWSIAWSPQSRYVASTWNSAWSGNRVRICGTCRAMNILRSGPMRET